MAMKVYESLEQGTPEWFEARAGIITCSELKSVMSKGRGKEPSKTRRTYMLKMIAEQITGTPTESFTNDDMDRGNRHEPIARTKYEDISFNDVVQVGFITNHGIGFSPDGLVDDDGIIEIKSKRGDLHLDVLLKNEMPAEHVKQVQGGLWVAERNWCDFISFCPGLPLFVKRVYRDEKVISEISSACDAFYAELHELKSIIENMGK